VPRLFQSVFHAFQNHNDSTNDQTNSVRDKRRSGVLFLIVPMVPSLALKVIGCEGFLNLQR